MRNVYHIEHPTCILFGKCVRSSLWADVDAISSKRERLAADDDNNDSLPQSEGEQEEEQKLKERQMDTILNQHISRLTRLLSLCEGVSPDSKLPLSPLSVYSVYSSDLSRVQHLCTIAIGRLLVEQAAAIFLEKENGLQASGEKMKKKDQGKRGAQELWTRYGELQEEALTACNSFLNAGTVDSSSLSSEDPLLFPTLSAFRLLFLKEIYMARGTSYVQGLLLQEADSPLVVKGKQLWAPHLKKTNVRVQHFMRKQHLIDFDPFASRVMYGPICEALRTAVDGDLGPLQQIESAAALKISNNKATLLCALFQEVTATFAGSTFKGKVGPPIRALQKELKGNKAFVQWQQEVIGSLASPEAAHAFLEVTPQITQLHMLQLQCIYHAVGLAVSVQDRTPVFMHAVASPEQLMSLFVPTMPSDGQLALMQVLGGGWYECSNGHGYVVH